jgi:hypothetical protein
MWVLFGLIHLTICLARLGEHRRTPTLSHPHSNFCNTPSYHFDIQTDRQIARRRKPTHTHERPHTQIKAHKDKQVHVVEAYQEFSHKVEITEPEEILKEPILQNTKFQIDNKVMRFS